MKSAKILREKLESGQVILGIMTTFHLWLDLIEIAIKAGLDYLIIDTEHVGHDHELIADGCAFGRRSDFPVLIRPPQTEYAAVHTAADLGPCGLLLPMVESARQLDEAQQGIRMPPRGRRRVRGPGRHGGRRHRRWGGPSARLPVQRRAGADRIRRVGHRGRGVLSRGAVPRGRRAPRPEQRWAARELRGALPRVLLPGDRRRMPRRGLRGRV